MRFLMFEIVIFPSFFTLTSKHHVTLTMNDFKNIFVFSIFHQTDNLKSLKSTHQFLRYYFVRISPHILLIIDTNYMLINRVRIDCAISGSKEYLLLIIWAKNCNFFQKCTEKPLTAWTICWSAMSAFRLNCSIYFYTK